MGMFRKSDLAAGPDVPIDQVNAMKTQGYSNNQIIQTLQRDGYTSSQIFDAISQTEMNTQNPGLTNTMPEAPRETPHTNFAPANYGSSSSEEMIEAIIDEKWNELVRDINKVIEWKQKADSRLSQMDQQIADMKDQFDKLHAAIIGKIGDYDKNMLGVQAELSAMEKTFSKVLPTLVDNVNELSRITDRVKTQTPTAKPAKVKARPGEE